MNIQIFFFNKNKKYKILLNLVFYFLNENEIDNIEYIEYYIVFVVFLIFIIFIKSKQKKINKLIKNSIFRFIKFINIFENIRIFSL